MSNAHGFDNQEMIQACLNCQRPRCVNCFERTPVGNGKPKTLKINPETEEIVAVYPSVREAAAKHGVSKHKLGGAISEGSIFLGYIWRRSRV